MLELVTDVLNWEFVAKILNSPNSRLTQELHVVTTDYKIQLRTLLTDYFQLRILKFINGDSWEFRS